VAWRARSRKSGREGGAKREKKEEGREQWPDEAGREGEGRREEGLRRGKEEGGGREERGMRRTRLSYREEGCLGGRNEREGGGRGRECASELEGGRERSGGGTNFKE